MKDKQEVTFEFRSDKGALLGNLKLRASHRGIKSHEIKFKNVTCVNVPEKDVPTNEFPIEYCKFNSSNSLSKIMLLEETNYDILFVAEEEKEIDNFLEEINESVFIQNLFNENNSSRKGVLNFKSYVGQTYLSVEVEGVKSLPIDIEIRSKKIGYATEYADMMADLSEDCSSLIYDLLSPVYQHFDISNVDRKTLYEDFLFLEYLFKEINLPDAYIKIKESPKTHLEKEKDLVPIGFVQSMEMEDLLDIICMPQFLTRVENVPSRWPDTMKNYIPLEVLETTFAETLDIPENRFVKFFLEQVYDLILKLRESYKNKGYIKNRLDFFHEQISDFLSDQWLKDVGVLTSIPMNSQILQKKEGYRDVYYFYLNFEFAFRFNWEDLEDSLTASEKRMSQLYEYWCFFRLLNALRNVANLKTDINDLVELLDDGWRIKLKRGKKSKIKFSFLGHEKNEHSFELYYNRGFTSRGKIENRSYSLPFRPDYTIVYYSTSNKPSYLHFDAKYRSQKELEDFRFGEKLKYTFDGSDELNEEEQSKINEIKNQESSRKYKNADIYKMHTYKDGILNSHGAYILYPGNKEGIFMEYDDYIVPSIGALPLKPGSDYYEFSEKVGNILNELINSKSV